MSNQTQGRLSNAHLDPQPSTCLNPITWWPSLHELFIIIIIIIIIIIELYMQYRKERWYKYERWKHWLVVCTEGLLEG